MRSFDWERFLKRWSQEMIDSIGNDRANLPSDVLQAGWFGYPGATEKQIARTEARLGVALPPSYRAFLRLTNGWRQTPLFSNQLWSAKDIEWFVVRHQDWIDAFREKTGYHAESSNAKAPSPSIPHEEYFVYGQEQDCSKIRVEYLQTALEISKCGDGAIYLLNPQIVNSEGEWEAWFFGDWLPGADRYRSFQDMMEAEYESFLELRETPSNAIASVLQVESATAIAIQAIAPAVIASESAVTPIEASTEAASPSSIPITEADWQALASFTINVQTRQGHREQRTVIRHRETDTVETRSDLDTGAIQQWMLKQLSGSADQPQAEASVEVEITQLRVIRSPQTEQAMIADQAQPLFLDPLQRGEPFVLEVSMVVASAATQRAEQKLVYRAQCVARHLSTQLNTDLGDITTQFAGGNQSTYTARFPEARLQQPGLYRLKIWVTLQNTSAAPSCFKVPMLQVV